MSDYYIVPTQALFKPGETYDDDGYQTNRRQTVLCPHCGAWISEALDICTDPDHRCKGT